MAAVVVGTGADAAGGINGFMESLSGRSGTLLSRMGSAIPFGFAFGAGMAATVNPCGFAMLPAYLGLYVGNQGDARLNLNSLPQLKKALLVGSVVAAGLILLFTTVGAIIALGGWAFVGIMPWLGLGVGTTMIGLGSWLLCGGKLYSNLPSQAAARIGNPNRIGVKGYFLFGISYGTASLSCTLPIFLAVVSSSLVTSGLLPAIGQFVLYGLGMGVVILFLTIAIAMFKGAMVDGIRRIQPHIQYFSAAVVILAGCYIVFYWLTLGNALLFP